MTLDLEDLRCPEALIRGKKALATLRGNPEASHLAIKTVEPSLKRDLQYYIAHTGHENIVHDKRRLASDEEVRNWKNKGAVVEELEDIHVHELVFQK